MSRIYKEENVLLGTLGAFLLSLIGAVLWLLGWRALKISMFIGIATVLCAVAGYERFGRGLAVKSVKNFSFKGVLISLAISVAVLIVTWHLGLSRDVYKVAWNNYVDGYISAPYTYAQALLNPYYFFNKPQYVVQSILKLGACLGFGIAFGVVLAVMCKDDEREEAEKVKSKLNGKPTSWDE